MNDDFQTSAVMNRVEDELSKLRREQRHVTLCLVVLLVAILLSRFSPDTRPVQIYGVVLLFAIAADLQSIRRSIRMMESIAAMFPKKISGSETGSD